MSVNTKVPDPWYGRDNQLNDCGPNAIRNAYVFFGLKCPLTYKEFEKAGFGSDGRPGVLFKKLDSFVTDESMGLETTIVSVYDETDFLNKIKTAREKNHPIIVTCENHIYTIIPHKITKNVGGIYSVEFVTPNNKYGVRYDLPSGGLNGFKTDLCLCVNYNFGEKNYSNGINLNDEPESLAFFTAEFIYKELCKGCKAGFYKVKFYEIKCVNMENYNFRSARPKKYGWEATDIEYKKRKAIKKSLVEGVYKEVVDILRECSKYGDVGSVKVANDVLRFLYKEVFTTYGIGSSLKEDFNKNLPALIGERRIIEIAK